MRPLCLALLFPQRAVGSLLLVLALGGCGRPAASPVAGSAPPPAAAATPAAAAAPSVRPAPPWLGRWTSAPGGEEQVGFDLRADGTAQAFVFKGWARPQPVAGQWATNPDGRSASLVMGGGGFAPMTLLPGPAGLLARGDLGTVALSACPGERWPWQDVDFTRRELLDGQVADLGDIRSLLYYTAEGIDVLRGKQRLAGRPTEGLAAGTLLAPGPILQAMRARLDALIREGKDPRWTEAARERLAGGRDRLGHPYEFYWNGGLDGVLVGIAPETHAAFRAVEEPAWRRTHGGEMAQLYGRTDGPWQDFVRPGSREVAAVDPRAAAPASPTAVPFGPGAAIVPAGRRVEVVTLIEAGLTERGNTAVPVGDFEAFAGREGWLTPNDPARRCYGGAFLDLLRRLGAQGLLTLTERESVAAAGREATGTDVPTPIATRVYHLAPSERLREMADPTRSVPGRSLYVPLTGFAVLTVDEARPGSEEPAGGATRATGALLVSGTYRPLPSALYLSARPDYPRRDLRFRALLRPGAGGPERPFTLAALDYGLLDQEGWLTHELP